MKVRFQQQRHAFGCFESAEDPASKNISKTKHSLF